MISFDDADGGRCGGVPVTRIEDGHAHGLGVSFVFVLIFNLETGRVQLWDGLRLLLERLNEISW